MGINITKSQKTTQLDLTKLRNYICDKFIDETHDDGSLAPLMLRFAWHLCGTYSKHDKTGGSNGNTMRFTEEKNDPENAGFSKAFQFVHDVEEKFKELNLSKADIQVLCGNVAIESMGGPNIPFQIGRVDFSHEEAMKRYGITRCPFGDGKFNPNKSRLPAADLGPNPESPNHEDPRIREKPTIDAIRNTFSRMGFTDKETVCLIVLGHQFGRSHPEVSGYDHPWYAFDPAQWNIFEYGLGWISTFFGGGFKEEKSSMGKRQWNLRLYGMCEEPFMMMPVDKVLYWDDNYREHLTFYNINRKQFRIDAVKVWTKLSELGVPRENLVPEK